MVNERMIPLLPCASVDEIIRLEDRLGANALLDAIAAAELTEVDRVRLHGLLDQAAELRID